jgi:hypothetical protein
MIAPYMKQLVDYCHSIGLVFDLHSCGKIEPLIPVMIECGVDKWAGQPLNDKQMLIEKYGDKILIGSTDTLDPLPGEAPMEGEQLKQAVAEYMRYYACKVPENVFFLMDHVPNDAVVSAFYKAGREILFNA